MNTQLVRIGTRKSPLAVRQAQIVKEQLQTLYPAGHFEILLIQTSGDKAPYIEQNLPLIELGGKGLFTKELEEALLANRIDLAVHSYKDVSTTLSAGLMICAVLEREDPRDVWISMGAPTLQGMAPDSIIGTSSLRRQAQILHLRPDCKAVPLRGNVQTRLEKVKSGLCDATLLAAAGLKRLNLESNITNFFTCQEILPAPAQGALALECRIMDQTIQQLISPLNHIIAEVTTSAERAFLKILDGNCRKPIAALATIEEDTLTLEGLVADPNGQEVRRDIIRGNPTDAIQLGVELGLTLKSQCSWEH